MKYLRKLPGKLVGKSVDKYDNDRYRMSLQNREQHIKKEKECRLTPCGEGNIFGPDFPSISFSK
mgnify:CR=1 FL=1